MAINDADSTRGTSRARRVMIALNVVVSISAAVALVVMVNYLAGLGAFRKDVQSLGQYGISERTRLLARDIDKPVTLTVVYTSARPERDASQYGPRVTELCRDIAELSNQIDVRVVRGDRDKAELATRLWGLLAEQAPAHRKLITDFVRFAEDASTEIPAEEQAWAERRNDKLLAEFALVTQITEALENARESIQQTRLQVQQRTDQSQATELPNYREIAEMVLSASSGIDKTLGSLDTTLQQIDSARRALSADDGKLLNRQIEAAAKLQDALTRLTDLAGKPGTPMPFNSSGVLKQLGLAAAEAQKQGQAFQTITMSLTEAQPVLARARSFSTVQQSGQMQFRLPMPQVLFAVAMALEQAGARATQSSALPADQQNAALVELRVQFEAIASQLDAASGKWVSLLNAVAKPDASSAAVLAQADKGLLDSLRERIRRIIADSAKLPALPHGDLGQKLSDSMVVVEVGAQDKDKAIDVVGFDSVWPVASSQPVTAPDESPRRTFNGDQAIGATLLDLTHGDLAEVVLTYFEAAPRYANPYQQAPSVAGRPPRQQMRMLADALRRAKLKVVEWNLAGRGTLADIPAGIDPALPRVLLVLPLPVQATGQGVPAPFGAKALDKIDTVIEAGTPAMFLTSFSFTGRPENNASPLADYLLKTWGLRPRDDRFVLHGQPNPHQKDQFKAPLLSTNWLSLSSFTDHPVGRSLRARQLYWLGLCPIMRADDQPDGVSYQTIFEAPENPAGFWAESQVKELVDAVFRGELTEVNPAERFGSIMPPFDLAVAAEKKAGDKTARIIVASCGLTYSDGYLTQPVMDIRGDVTRKAAPPPTDTLDLAVNACYWLSGNEKYIAPGPADIAPVRYIPPGEMAVLRTLVIAAMPGLVLVIGITVLLSRRR